MARPLYTFKDGERVPQPFQPNMAVNYTDASSVKEGVIEGVRFTYATYKRNRVPEYLYTVSGFATPLHQASVISSEWSDKGERPEFVYGQECFIDVEHRGNDIKAIVQVQTSLNGRANVILYDPDRNELYLSRKTTLKKMLEKKAKQQDSPPPTSSSPDLHKIAV